WSLTWSHDGGAERADGRSRCRTTSSPERSSSAARLRRRTPGSSAREPGGERFDVRSARAEEQREQDEEHERDGERGGRGIAEARDPRVARERDDLVLRQRPRRRERRAPAADALDLGLHGRDQDLHAARVARAVAAAE